MLFNQPPPIHADLSRFSKRTNSGIVEEKQQQPCHGGTVLSAEQVTACLMTVGYGNSNLYA